MEEQIGEECTGWYNEINKLILFYALILHI